MVFIIVRNRAEGIHQYEEAPAEVGFLRHPHRHVFYVESEIEVFHDDRELEFILVQRKIQAFLERILAQPRTVSCEAIAREVQHFLQLAYAVPTRNRVVNVKVFEDNENGAYVVDYRMPTSVDQIQTSGFCYVCGKETSTKLVEGPTVYYLCLDHLYQHAKANYEAKERAGNGHSRELPRQDGSGRP